MKYLFRIIRWPLGQIIIFFDWVTRPAEPQYSAERRAEIDAIASTMQLYQFKQCPFCVKTRRNMRRLGLNIELRDARNDPRWKRELIEGGGKYQVPCLRLAGTDGDSEWLYGSADIIAYLERRLA